MRCRTPILLAILCTCSTLNAASADPSTDAPISHPVYRFLDRMEARGFLAGSLPGDRPWSRRRIAGWLTPLSAPPIQRLLTSAERAALLRHLSEFAAPPLRGPIPSTARTGGRPLSGPVFVFEDTTTSIRVSPLFRQDLFAFRGSERAEEAVSVTYVGARTQAEAYGRLGLRVGHFEAREWGSRPRTTRPDIVASPIEEPQFKGHIVDFRESRYQFLWSCRGLRIDVGKEAFDWGPARDANLLLHDSGPSYVYGRLRFEHRAVRFTHLIASLSARPGRIDASRTTVENGHPRYFPPAKRLSAHRLELRLGKTVILGLQEAVVYANRGYELAYISPAAVFVGAQSYLGNKDNLTLGVDLAVLIPGRAKLYGALFFDDLAKFSPGSLANKFALQLGLFAVDPLGLNDTSVRIEGVVLQPYTYSHNFTDNTWEHFDTPLGHPTGPNALRLYLDVHRSAGSRFDLAMSAVYEKRGENLTDSEGHVIENVGGDPQLGRRVPIDPYRKDFLAGIIETERRLRATARVHLTPVLSVQAGVQSTWLRNVQLGPSLRGSDSYQELSASLRLNAF